MFSQVEHDHVEARVGELMGVINTSTAELVSVLADVLISEMWSVAGVRSAEHWVTWQCGVSHARATQLVHMARRRAELPRTSDVFDAGQLTEDAMAAVARRTPTERDAEVAELAPALLYSQPSSSVSSSTPARCAVAWRCASRTTSARHPVMSRRSCHGWACSSSLMRRWARR
jgi:hypothetical protein